MPKPIARSRKPSGGGREKSVPLAGKGGGSVGRSGVTTGSDAGAPGPDEAGDTKEATFLSPLAPPGPPPVKKRGRPSKADTEAEEKAKSAASEAEETKRREEQGKEVAKLLSLGVRYVSRTTLPEEKRLTEEENKELSEAGAAILVKYVDLRGMEKYKEELTFAWVLGKIITKRMDFDAPTESERDSGEGGDGEEQTP